MFGLTLNRDFRILLTSNLLSSEILIAVIFILILTYLWSDIKNYLVAYGKLVKAAKSFPGPPTLPLIGNALIFAGHRDEILNKLMKLGKTNPDTFRVWLGPVLAIVITNPKDYEIVLSSPKIIEKAFFYNLMEPIAINSLINGKGPKMRARRKMIIPIINGKQLSSYIQSFNFHTRRCVKLLTKREGNGEFDVFNDMELCISDIIYETLFGIEGTAQINGDASIAQIIENAINILWERILKIWLHPSFIFHMTKNGKVWRESDILLREYLNKIITDKQRIYEALEKGEENIERPKPSILDSVIETAVRTKSISVDEIRYDMIASFVGSNDTIHGVISFALLMIAMHPDVQEKVREEILDVVGADSDVCEEHISKLIYMEMVIKETIRLFPVGPLIARSVTEDIDIENYTVPKGSTLAILACVTHRSEKYWTEPEKFIPERFLPENSKDRHPYAFIPFSGGLRGCPGYKFGLACLKVLIVHFVRNYQFSTTMKLETMKLKTHISVRSASGYRMSIKKIIS
ncbi:cytochrome P450 4C1-like [Microplitis mediator]|uniref:cytochrome P450 4C1-like n=1 Tax=Microplitis mediator TaxID=375433 RepID=UPI0025548E30|nr:cytochrome P450 4C1-like [Microplitis mediator]